MADQVQVLGVCVDKQRLGYAALSLTHFGDIAEPSVTAGSKIECGGALYQFSADEAESGGTWAGIANSTSVYIYFVPAGSTATWIYSDTAPTWSTSKAGWYSGSNRCIGLLWKDASGNYEGKELLGALTASLGKLRHLPLGNTTSRGLPGSVPPLLGNWSAAITAAGVLGIPIIAKAIRVKVLLNAYPTAAGDAMLGVAFSDNNSNVPTIGTAHPQVHMRVKVVAAGDYFAYVAELDISLNASGQFYEYTFANTNVTTASSIVQVVAVGYYLGD